VGSIPTPGTNKMKTAIAWMSVAVLLLAPLTDAQSPRRVRLLGGTKCATVTDGRDWPNPYIVVAATGLTVTSGSPSPQPHEMPVEQLASFLKKLPKSAWPCGKVAALQPAGVIGIHDQAPIAENLQKVKRILKRLSIRMDPWPSA
jgi:hypothetical protein